MSGSSLPPSQPLRREGRGGESGFAGPRHHRARQINQQASRLPVQVPNAGEGMNRAPATPGKQRASLRCQDLVQGHSAARKVV